MGTVISILVALGSLAGLALWIGRKFFGKTASVRKLVEKVDEITRKIVNLERLPRTYRRAGHLSKLYKLRKELNTKIARLRSEE